jgi:hypothetical protein
LRPAAFLVAMSMAAAPHVAGCSANLCFLQVNGRCTLSSCGAGQYFDNQRHTCVCEQGRFAIDGACLAQAEANQSCGRGAVFTPQGCQPLTCVPGFVVDLDRDACVAKADIDRAAGAANGQTLACAQGTVLEVSGGIASCVPVAQSCQRDESWNGQACAKLPSCPTGFDVDPSSMRCVQVSAPPASQGDSATLDTNAWARVNLGEPGGQGAPQLCAGLARRPLSFGILAGGSARVIATVSLGFADGTTGSATAQTAGVIEASNQPVLPRGAQDLQAAVDASLASLRAQKAKPAPTSLTTVVRCTIVNGAPPAIVPSTGGA